MASVMQNNARSNGENHVQTLESDTLTATGIRLTGAASEDTDSDESTEDLVNERSVHPPLKDFTKTGKDRRIQNQSVNHSPAESKSSDCSKADDKDDLGRHTTASNQLGSEQRVTGNEEGSRDRAPSQQLREKTSPVRFNPFDREDYREDIQNVFPQLKKSASPAAAAMVTASQQNTDTREDLVTSISSDGRMDSMDSMPAQAPVTMEITMVTELGLTENHFSQPDGFDYTSMDALKMAIEDYKQRVVKSTAHTEARRELVQQLVKLRLRLAEAQEEPEEEDPDTKHVVGHHFQKRDGTSGQRFCEKCNGVIWGVLQTWYRCSDCGFCCHTKCLNLITRICASERVTENPHYIVSICPERGLGSQNYRCLECRAPISFQPGFGEPRQCDYTGAYYCELCHWNDTMIIPARVLRNWDFEPKKVCRASKQFLKLMSLRSVLRIQDINPMLFNFVEELNEVKKLREEILIMKKYFLSCKAALDSKLLLQLQDRQHFVENSDMYSLYDLEEVVSDVLLPHLAKIHASFAQHIKTDCQLCRVKGFICELCEYQEVLFPFDNHAIVCTQCFTVLHRHCYMRREQRCPKCERIERRTGDVPDLRELTGNTVALTTEGSVFIMS